MHDSFSQSDECAFLISLWVIIWSTAWVFQHNAIIQVIAVCWWWSSVKNHYKSLTVWSEIYSDNNATLFMLDQSDNYMSAVTVFIRQQCFFIKIHVRELGSYVWSEMANMDWSLSNSLSSFSVGFVKSNCWAFKPALKLKNFFSHWPISHYVKTAIRAL